MAGTLSGGGPRRERAIALDDVVEGRPLTLQVCRRCGERHPGLPFRRLDPPIVVTATALITDWATCPNTGEPTLLLVETIPNPIGEMTP